MRPLSPRVLIGDARTRGMAQATIPKIDPDAIRRAIEQRHAAARTILSSPDARTFLVRQRIFADKHCPTEIAELLGISAGFDICEDTLFALLHLPVLSGSFAVDGCSAWARPRDGGGAVLAKNRDLSGPRRDWQEVFLHRDPDAPAGAVLCVGTIGMPGAYSSGMNATGLALADTAVQAPHHATGWLRYFLMTHLLKTCRSVDEACDRILSFRHAGGGSLILADSFGAVAAAELFHTGALIERSAPVCRSNHFLGEVPEAVAARMTPPAFRSSVGRLAILKRLLDEGLGLTGIADIPAAMADHGACDREALCRHGEGDDSHTISCAIYDTANGRMMFSRGAPCGDHWETARLAELVGEDAA